MLRGGFAGRVFGVFCPLCFSALYRARRALRTCYHHIVSKSETTFVISHDRLRCKSIEHTRSSRSWTRLEGVSTGRPETGDREESSDTGHRRPRTFRSIVTIIHRSLTINHETIHDRATNSRKYRYTEWTVGFSYIIERSEVPGERRQQLSRIKQ